MDTGSVRVAIAQASPVYLDRDATVDKACRLIEDAGAQEASLVAFPEGFVPGHPLWYHFHAATGPVSRELATRLYRNAVVIPGPETEALGAAAARAQCHVMIGACERASAHAGTLYNSQVLIGPDGRVLNVHRKLTPTVGERLVHAPGDASGLRVVDTAIGRISGLICGESSNPLAVFTLIAESTQIHVISWPDFPGRGMLSRAERGSRRQPWPRLHEQGVHPQCDRRSERRDAHDPSVEFRRRPLSRRPHPHRRVLRRRP